MIYLILGFVFFCVFVISHILCARCGLMNVQLSRLLFLSIFWLVVYAAIVQLFDVAAGPGMRSAPLLFTSQALYFLICLTYIVECSLVPYGSPSMKILEWVSRQADAEATHGQLREFLAGEKLIQTRLEDLIAGSYIHFDGARYRLQPRGLRIARLMKAYRGILRREAGG